MSDNLKKQIIVALEEGEKVRLYLDLNASQKDIIYSVGSGGQNKITLEDALGNTWDVALEKETISDAVKNLKQSSLGYIDCGLWQ